MNTQPLILDIGYIQRRIHAVQLDIARYGVTLRLADFATLLMLFVFLVGFYVADPFHIASFIAQRFGANGTVELAVYALLLVSCGGCTLFGRLLGRYPESTVLSVVSGGI